MRLFLVVVDKSLNLQVKAFALAFRVLNQYIILKLYLNNFSTYLV